MLLYRLTFFPDGHLDAERTEIDDLDPAIVAPFESLFAHGVSFNGPMPDASEVRVKFTGAESGQALLSCSYRGQLFLSGAVVGGLDTGSDTELLGLFIQSLEGTPLLQQITGGRPNPFGPLLERPERPLVVTVIWPTLPADMFAKLAGLDLLLSIAFLRRLGVAVPNR